MIFYRLTDNEAKRGNIALGAGTPIIFLIANGLSRTNGTAIGYGFVALMAVLYILILWQIWESRRLNQAERGDIVSD